MRYFSAFQAPLTFVLLASECCAPSLAALLIFDPGWFPALLLAPYLPVLLHLSRHQLPGPGPLMFTLWVPRAACWLQPLGSPLPVALPLASYFPGVPESPAIALLVPVSNLPKSWHASSSARCPKHFRKTYSIAMI